MYEWLECIYREKNNNKSVMLEDYTVPENSGSPEGVDSQEAVPAVSLQPS